MIECKICNREFKSYKGLSGHIRQTHKISSENYYITYIDSNNKCLVCNNSTNFISLKDGFYKHCSVICSCNDPNVIEKQITTFKSKPENVEKARINMINRNKSDKARQTSSKIGKRTGSITMSKLHKENDGLKYCEKCSTNTKHTIGIGCMTCFNKDESHKQSIINTIKERYGEEYTNVYQVPEIKEKIVQVSLEKYGTTNPGNSREARIKANKTMRSNGNGSSCEDYFEEALIKLDIKYEKQYKDERYPFLCDFYLPDSDTFIELNIYWSHNDHWYDSENENDVKMLKEWINKAEAGHKQYENAVAVWSDKDLKKREYAIKNRLNYVVL